MLASKFFDDVYYNNAYYARVGGISNIEVTPHASSLRPTPYLLLPTHYCQRTTALYFLLHSTSYCTTSYSLLPTHYFLLHSTSYSLLHCSGLLPSTSDHLTVLPSSYHHTYHHTTSQVTSLEMEMLRQTLTPTLALTLALALTRLTR